MRTLLARSPALATGTFEGPSAKAAKLVLDR